MAELHLVTGHQNYAHVSAADQGLFNAGIAGTGEYVFNIGQRFKAEIQSNNLVRVYDGTLVVNGRHVILARGGWVDLTIENGAVGVKRYDLICVKYSMDTATGVESASFEVIKGTASATTPSDPTGTISNNIITGYHTHHMRLYRVILDGLTITKVEPLFQILAPASDFHQSFYKQNMLINGDFLCNQRGQKSYDITDAAAYTVDMWRAYQVKVETGIYGGGVKLTGKSATEQGYFTQFIQLGLLEGATYTISAMVDNKICTFVVSPGAEAKEMNFGKFKISALTTSIWDNNMPENNYYSNKLKVNICPIGTNSITVKYVDVFKGDVAYPHVAEDYATAIMRCKRYIQKGCYVSPFTYVTTGTNQYQFAICYDKMAFTEKTAPTVESCTYSYYNEAGGSESKALDKLTIVTHNNEGIITLRTASITSMSQYVHAFRGVYLVTCEPTDA